MITFETKRHIEIDESYQGINLTEFAFSIKNPLENDQIVDIFIRSKHFTYESLRDCIKKETDVKFLRRAFNIEKIKISDFKKINKEGTTKFLIDFLNEKDWGDDKNEFATLLNKYFEIHQQLGNNDFYVISKDWFERDDEKVIQPESWCYIYYFFIISVDRNSNLLTFTEWKYD
ncbi:MAG TPA: hypothetical protein PLP39_09785, partial [Flavobacterium lutivivi]|jgi:hypothetical protein|nr:hypothetical protein [Flavobacterium lutivivi]